MVKNTVRFHGAMCSNAYLPGMYNDWGVRPVLWRLLTDRC